VNKQNTNRKGVLLLRLALGKGKRKVIVAKARQGRERVAAAKGGGRAIQGHLSSGPNSSCGRKE